VATAEPPKPVSAPPPPAVKPAEKSTPGASEYQKTLENAMFLLSERRWIKAVDRFTDALKLDPNAAMAYLGRCRAHAALQDFAKATADCSSALRLQPNSADAYHERGNAYLQSQNFDRALDDLTQAIRLGDSDMAMAYNLRGRAHSGLKQWT